MHSYYYSIGDYRRDTSHLEPIEHYIYRTLIDDYYLDEKPIINDESKLLRLLRLDPDKLKFLQNVLNDFFIPSNEGWKHKRIQQQITEYKALCEKNKKNGSLGGRPLKNRSVSDRKANGKQTINNKQYKKNIKKKIFIPENFNVSDQVRSWAMSKGIHNIDDHLEPFIISCKAKGYQYVNWDMAFMNAVKSDWAKLGHGSDDGFQAAQ